MPTDEEGESAPALEGFPLSRRIAQGVAQMSHAVTCMERVGAPRCGVADESIAREQPDVHLLDPDPDRMARIKIGRVREVERAVEVEDQLEINTPQFFLRHTHRVERFADDRWLEYEHDKIRDLGYVDDLRDVRHCSFEKWGGDVDLCSMKVSQYLADRRTLMVDTAWRDVFGRPDPVLEDS